MKYLEKLKKYIEEQIVQPRQWLHQSSDLDDTEYIGVCLGKIKAYEDVLCYIDQLKNLEETK